jgi:hypothetical protein
VAGEQRVDTLNARKRVTHARTHCFPRALRSIAESPLAAAESSSRAELVDEGVSLGARAFRPALVASSISLGDLTPELRQPPGGLAQPPPYELELLAAPKDRGAFKVWKHAQPYLQAAVPACARDVNPWVYSGGTVRIRDATAQSEVLAA